MLDVNITKDELLDTFGRLAGRIELLVGEQKAFVRLFQSIGDFKCIAKAANVHEATVARRLRKIAQRISDDKFISALTDDAKIEVVKKKYVNGKSARQIAIETGMSKYKVWKMIKKGIGNRIEN
ncbi:MAG: hypothetical protein WC770_07995 [Phycisphaerae bacterium]|jgi:DNA invertase Pin-like site-specific DNA recombinase